MAAYSTANDPIMKRYIELLRTIRGDLVGAPVRPTSLGMKTSTMTDVLPERRFTKIPEPDMALVEAEEEEEAFDPTRGRYQERPILVKETVVTPDADADAEEQPSMLGRLGGLIKNNPEVAAQIAQAAGGLMSNIARGRAEREAGKETEGRVARANLISALTGGKARPQVTAAQADEGGLLSRLGQMTRAGGRVAAGEMARRRAEDVQERELGLQEREVAVKEAQQQADAEYKKASAQIKETGSSVGSARTKDQISQLQGTSDIINKFAADFADFEGLEGVVKGQLSRLPGGGFTAPKAKLYQDQRALLVGTVAKIINGGGGQISNYEQQLAEAVVPDLTTPADVGELGQQKFARLNEIVQLRMDALRRGDTQSLDVTVGNMIGQEAASVEFDPADQSILQSALDGDAEAERQIRAKYPHLMDQ